MWQYLNILGEASFRGLFLVQAHFLPPEAVSQATKRQTMWQLMMLDIFTI